jgi:hypothetical protein
MSEWAEWLQECARALRPQRCGVQDVELIDVGVAQETPKEAFPGRVSAHEAPPGGVNDGLGVKE